MSSYTRQEVAQRAGVDPNYVDRLVELGITLPDAGDAFSRGDVLRARWVRLGAGRRAARGNRCRRPGWSALVLLHGCDGVRSLRRLSGTTFQKLQRKDRSSGAACGGGREAVGFAEPRPEDHVHDNELSVVPLIQLQLSEGFRPVVIERWLRVYGDSSRRIAETETACGGAARS